MDFYMQANAAESAPKLSTLTEKGHFTSGSPELAIPPSTPGAAWFESVTSEIVSAISKLGGTPSRDKIDQLADTLLAKFALKADLESPVLTGDVTVPEPTQDHNPVTKAYLVDLLKRMSNVPTGAVLTIAGDKVPEGYLLCNGAAISRSTYAKLFDAIGTLYGDGDGATTFNLPDMRNRFAEGAGTYSVGTAVEAGLPNITGSFGVAGSPIGDIVHNFSGAFSNNSLGGNCFVANTNNGIAGGVDFKASGSNSIYGNSSIVQPPALILNYVIKY